MSKESRDYFLSKATIKVLDKKAVVCLDEASNILEEYSDRNTQDLMDLLFKVKNSIEENVTISKNSDLYKDIEKVFEG